MNRYTTGKIFLFVLILFFLSGENAYSQNNQSVIQWFKDQYDYINPDLEVSQDSLTKMAELWRNSADKTKSEKSRQEALKNLIQTMVHVQGAEQQYTPAAITALVARFRSLEGLSLPPDNQIHNGVATVSYEDVKSIGNGDTDIILLSDIFADVSIYKPLMEEAREYFTFHPLTLPGVGSTPPLALPESREYVDAPWFSSIERAVVEYVKRNSISKPMIVGIWGSGYLAVRLATKHPDLFGRAVVINAPVNILFGLDLTNPTGISPVQARINYFNAQIPNIFPLPDENTSRGNARGRSEFYTSNRDVLPGLIDVLSSVTPLVLQQYIGELFTRNYSQDLQYLSIPLLAVTSLHEPDGLSGSGSSPFLVGEWQKAKKRYPNVPIEQVILEDTRTYVSLDAPKALAQILRGFQRDEIMDPIDADPTQRRYQLSPRVTHRSFIGATAIEIDHGSPSMRGREIYGNVVRYDTPWRAGANNITSIKFYENVIIGGREVPEGKYGFFVIPREEKPWEGILTTYSAGSGAGAFSYDSTYKFISFDVEPLENNPEEHLRYFVEQLSPLHGVIGFTWAGKRFEVEVETPAHIQAISQTQLSSVPRSGWKVLGTESEPDASNPDNADAAEVEYHYDRDSGMIWFRISLQKAVDHSNVGINLVLDTDQNQSTGAGWWGGSNSSFTYDRVGTLWIRKTATGKYAGTIGISGFEYVTNNGDLTRDAVNNFRFVADEEQHLWYLGARLDDLDSDGRFDMNIAVGTSSSWNDDLPNNGSLKVDLTDTFK